MTGATDTARSHRAEAAALVDELSTTSLLRPDAASWLAPPSLSRPLRRSRRARESCSSSLARPDEGIPCSACTDPAQDLVRAREAGRGRRAAGRRHRVRAPARPRPLAGNLFNRSVVAVAVGDLDIALATAEEGVELTQHLDEGFVAAWAAVRLAGVLLETREPDRAVELLIGRAGGEELTLIPGGWRAYCLELLTRCWLALDRRNEAERSGAHRAHRGGRAASPRHRLGPIACHRQPSTRVTPRAPVARPRPAAAADDDVEAPIEAALSRVLAGRALVEAGERDLAVAELERAAARLDACGALRYRDESGSRKARPAGPSAYAAG